jgi:ribosomal protein L7/L12
MQRDFRFSSELVYHAVSFLRTCRKEIGEEMGADKVNAMMDAFDPELKAQIFMQMLMGDIGIIVVRRNMNTLDHKKINAIKAVRRVSGWGLREAKDFVDQCTEVGHKIDGTFSLEQVQAFKDDMHGSGYIVD